MPENKSPHCILLIYTKESGDPTKIDLLLEDAPAVGTTINEWCHGREVIATVTGHRQIEAKDGEIPTHALEVTAKESGI